MSNFPSEFYEAHAIPVCPNGDKVRSDENGLFCWIEGERVPYPVPSNWVPPSQRVDVEPAQPIESAEPATPTESAIPSRRKPGV